MKFVTYQHHDEPRTGALVDNCVIDLHNAQQLVGGVPIPTEMTVLLHGGDAMVENCRRVVAAVQEQGDVAQDVSYALDQVQLLPPVLLPSKVICMGLNNMEHIIEVQETVPDYPALFHKTATALVGANRPIILPKISNQIGIEGELAIIIGKRGKYIEEQDALSHIAGYACANDVYALDIQARTSQWTSGCMLDTFCPLGPLVTRDEIPNPNQLQVKTYLNGKLLQTGNTRNLIFSVETIVSYISTLTTLLVGDIILTGTPASGGIATRLAAGDIAVVDIERLGKLINPVISETDIMKKGKCS
ncbi:MAG: fumarylacetoacetate hydrolase family protein [Candidatus Promineifilaceae bacterium]